MRIISEKLTLLMRKLLFILLFIPLSNLIAQQYVPGSHYFGYGRYVEYIAGNMPIIISAPHGGVVIPSIIPDRTASTCFNDPNYTTAYDTYTQEVVRSLDTSMLNYIGCRPHTIICRVARTKVDCNRSIDYGACGDTTAQKIWNDFHKYIGAARDFVNSTATRGLYIDFHGQGHSVQRLEIGYGASETDLQKSDAYLNTTSIKTNSSIQYMSNNNYHNQTHAQMLRGQYAFGTMMADAGYPSVPSLQDPYPLVGQPYFDGGYNIRRYGTADSGYIDAIQIESNRTNVRDNYANIKVFTDTLARVIVRYLLANAMMIPEVSQCLYTDINGTVKSVLGKVIPNVGMRLSGSLSDSAICNKGNYSLTERLGGNYVLRPYKTKEAIKRNGVSVLDAILIQKHILNTALLSSPYKIIAADVDNNGKVDVMDLVYLKRFILGLDTAFAGNRTWAFVDSSYTFSNPAKPFPYKDSISLPSLAKSVANKSFTGIKLGDVSYDWNAAILGTNVHQAKPIELFYTNINTSNATFIRIPIRVKNCKDIAGMQFTLNYNSLQLELFEIQTGNIKLDYNTHHSSEGKVSFIWMNGGNTSTTLEDSSVLVTLTFRKNGWLQNEDISLSNDVTAIGAWDVNLNNVSITKSGGKLSDLVEANTTSDNWEILPNPSSGSVQIKWQTEQSKTVSLRLFTASGKLLSTQNIKAEAHSIVPVHLDTKGKLLPGIYYLKANGLNDNSVKKIVIRY